MFVKPSRRGLRTLTGALAGATLAVTLGGSVPAGARPAGEPTRPAGSASVYTESAPAGSASAAADTGSLSAITQIIGAQEAWAAGLTGAGVDVAVIDTGVAPVLGLEPGRVINGPDLSFDGQTLPADRQGIDSFGHGTHLAGVIAGRDEDAVNTAGRCQACTGGSGYSDATRFVGVAPDARVLSVKVGAYDGAVDVSQVIAAVDWVVEHRNDNGMNIRVLNLSYGTLSAQPAGSDPLAFAVENAWRAGIVVVVAGGNDGLATTVLSDPAYDPMVIAVGASDPQGTLDVRDDTIPEFATHGTKERGVDIVAPGVGVTSLNVPGSFVDQNFYSGAGNRFVRGSGTSQSAAVVSGAVALILQRFPQATPDQVKQLLRSSATAFAAGASEHKGTGVVNVARAVRVGLPAVQSATSSSTGTGSLEAARGSDHLSIDGGVLVGEQDIFGNPWTVSGESVAGAPSPTWSGGIWHGTRWTGDGWGAAGWVNATWDRTSWAGTDWADISLASAVWDGSRWSGSRWSGSRWSGSRWSGSRWSGSRWSSAGWA